MHYAKCSGENCPISKTCLRKTGPGGIDQNWWFNTPPIDIETNECEFYINDKRIKVDNKK